MLLWFNKDKPDAEGSEKRKETETETLIFSETTAARQKVPDKHTKLTDIAQDKQAHRNWRLKVQ